MQIPHHFKLSWSLYFEGTLEELLKWNCCHFLQLTKHGSIPKKEAVKEFLQLLSKQFRNNFHSVIKRLFGQKFRDTNILAFLLSKEFWGITVEVPLSISFVLASFLFSDWKGEMFQTSKVHFLHLYWKNKKTHMHKKSPKHTTPQGSSVREKCHKAAIYIYIYFFFFLRSHKSKNTLWVTYLWNMFLVDQVS